MKVQKRGHGLGPPHIYAMLGMLEGFASLAVPDADKALETYKKLTTEQQTKLLLFCRVSKVYKEEFARVTLAFSHLPEGLELQAKIGQFIKALPAATQDQPDPETAWERKMGRAPASHQERELQRMLEQMMQQ